MPNDILFRTTDINKWGAGKGTNLTAGEVDENFWNLLSRLVSVETNPSEPKQIQLLTVTGNQLTITLSDGVTTFGPYTLPTAAFVFRGAWEAGVSYAVNDLFTRSDGLYLVLRAYTAPTSFDPADGYGLNPYFSRVVSLDNYLDLSFFVTAPFADGELLLKKVVTRPFVLPIDLPGSVVRCSSEITGSATVIIKRGMTEIATATFTDSDTAVLASNQDESFAAGDVLSIYAPDPTNVTLSDLCVSLLGTRV